MQKIWEHQFSKLFPLLLIMQWVSWSLLPPLDHPTLWNPTILNLTSLTWLDDKPMWLLPTLFAYISSNCFAGRNCPKNEHWTECDFCSENDCQEGIRCVGCSDPSKRERRQQTLSERFSGTIQLFPNRSVHVMTGPWIMLLTWEWMCLWWWICKK